MLKKIQYFVTTFVPFNMWQSLRSLHNSHLIGDELNIMAQKRDYFHQNTRDWDHIVVAKISFLFAFALLLGQYHRVVVDYPKIAGIVTS